MLRLLRTLPALSLALLCANCADPGGQVTCSPAPIDRLTALPQQWVAPAEGQVVSVIDGTALATSGTTNLAVWARAQRVYAAHLDGEGTMLGALPALIGAEAMTIAPTATWNGARFLVTWFDVTGGARVTPIAADGTVSDAGPPLAAGGVWADRTAAASNGSETLFIWSAWINDGSKVRGARIGADGAWLDAAPIDIADGYQADVAWDGASFVTVWTTPDDAHSLRAARISPAGEVLDAGGVYLADGAFGTVVPRDQGSSLVFGDGYGQRVAALRLDQALAPVDAAPVILAEKTPATNQGLVDPRVARAGDGRHLVAWEITGEYDTTRSMLQAFDQDFAEVGSPLEDASYGRNILGLEGSAYLTLRGFSAQRLRLTDSGLVADDAHPLQSERTEPSGPVVTAAEDGYLAVWEEAGLRARFLDASGAPAFESAVAISPQTRYWSGTTRVAWTGSSYLVAATKIDGLMELSVLEPGVDPPTTRTLGADPVIALGLACNAGSCLLAWSRRFADHDEIRGSFVAPDGSLSDEGGALLLTSPHPSDTDDLAVLPLADGFGLFWKNRGARVDAAGSSAALVPGLSLEWPDTRFVLAAGPDTLLAARWTEQVGAPAVLRTEILRHDGSRVAALDAPISIDGAAWDGASYVASSDRTLYVITADGHYPASVDLTLPGPAALASGAPGQTVAVGRAVPGEIDPPAILAQVVRRGVCE
jgi:hypothetical protein